jgi:hypothetical protein
MQVELTGNVIDTYKNSPDITSMNLVFHAF